MQSIAVIATYATILEVILIVMVVLISLSFKFYSQHQNKEDLKVHAEIQSFLSQHIENRKQISAASFPAKWLVLSTLLESITELDTVHTADNWLYLRANYIKTIILPLARTAATDTDWSMRHRAAITFSYYSENSDEKIILALLSDPIPLVRYTAAGAGIRHGSELLIKSIIVQISRENWLTQTLYLKGFVSIPFATYYYLENIMKHTDALDIRTTTYNLLLRFPVFPANWEITDDIHSRDARLAISAIRYLAYSKNISSVDTLLGLLGTPNWKVKTAVLASLGNLKSEEAIPGVQDCLDDENWWVRFSAAQALNEIGLSGKHPGERRNLTTNQLNMDVSQIILNTF